VWISLAVVAGIWRMDMVRGDIVDEAKALGKTPEDFPAASYDYFRAMDMVPAMEAMGYRLLLNEWVTIERGDERIYLAGIDDAHFYRTDDIPKAAAAIPRDAFSILLAHTPESYREAAKAGFDLMLSGHTHGGQLCLPGGIAIKLEARLPRRMGAGAWRFDKLAGYTSVGAGTSLAPVRLNCPAEITVHTLRRLW